MNKIILGRYSIDISHGDKILFPDSNITKLDLVNYYKKIATRMLSFMKGRPISMVRYPLGIKKKGFFQKEVGKYFPKWIDTKKIKKQGGYTNYVIVNKIATLVYLANQDCISPHIWLSKIDRINYPDHIIFDLDPSGNDFSMIQQGALLLKKRSEELGLRPFAMITGSRGIHIVIPIKRKHNFNYVRKFAYELARLVVLEHKDLFTLKIRKKKRKDLVYIDIMRNAFGQTTIAPYGVRPKYNAPVATPVFWKEVANSKLKPNKYNIKNIFKRLSVINDPWENISSEARFIPKL